MSGAVESVTTGYMLWGKIAGYAGRWHEEERRFSWFGQFDATVFPTLDALTQALLLCRQDLLGPVEIYKQVETTTTITTTHKSTQQVPLA